MPLEGTVSIDTQSCRANARIWSERVLEVFQHNRRKADGSIGAQLCSGVVENWRARQDKSGHSYVIAIPLVFEGSK